MEKLKAYLEKWMAGENVRGIRVTLYDIKECAYVYNVMAQKQKPCFINSKVKEVLDKCGIETAVKGIGWRVV